VRVIDLEWNSRSSIFSLLDHILGELILILQKRVSVIAV
jgi:hypothetical protein